MVEVVCKYAYTLFPKEKSDSPFKIVSYETEQPVEMPDGKYSKRIRAKGDFLPVAPGLKLTLRGEWSPWHDKVTKEIKGYTLSVKDYTEEKPSNEKGSIKYLETLDGVGKVTAKKIYEVFQANCFDVIENDFEKLEEIKGISFAKAKKIHISYIKRAEGRELYKFLYNYNVPDSIITKIYDEVGVDALKALKNNPYKLCYIDGFGFYTAEKIAQASENYNHLLILEERVKAAILEVLAEAEMGGRIFSTRNKLPRFAYNRFLQQAEFDVAMGPQDIFGITGNTCISQEILYLQILKILNMPGTVREMKLNYNSFLSILNKMHTERYIFLAKRDDGKFDVYRQNTAKAEYHISKKISELMRAKVKYPDNIMQRISNTENRLEMLLSAEQREAVKNSITSPVSIITGGPGTGKTAVQKVLLSTYETIYPEGKTIVLAAPTGMAAKKMSESTGRTASTIHSLLGLRGGDDYESMHYSEAQINADLIIIDEASMVDNFLMSALLLRISSGTQLVIVGDVDQLPSVGCGAVLKDLIESNVIPIVRLTNIFRQGPGSSITVNAARIKIGETSLMYEKDFVFIEKENTEEIIKEVEKIYSEQIKEKGVENVSVLSAYRKSTDTGVNKLNPVLRNLSNSKLDDTIPHFTNNGVTFYEGDKVMFTKNTTELINGDVGYIKKIISTNPTEIEVDFSDNLVHLEGEEIDCLVLAYATTVHKSQGSEYDTVIMVVDPAHKILLKRNLIYTGITRAKKQIYIIGERNAFRDAILTEDSVKRMTRLSDILKRDAPKKIKNEQLAFA